MSDLSNRAKSLIERAGSRSRPALARVGKEMGDFSDLVRDLSRRARRQAKPALVRAGREVGGLWNRANGLYHEARRQAKPALTRAGKEAENLSSRGKSFYHETRRQAKPALARFGKEVGGLWNQANGLYHEARRQGRPALTRVGKEIGSLSSQTRSLYNQTRRQARPTLARVGKEVGDFSSRANRLYHDVRRQAKPARARVGKEVAGLSSRANRLYHEARLQGRPALARVGKEIGSLSSQTRSLYNHTRRQAKPTLARVGKEMTNLPNRARIFYHDFGMKAKPASPPAGEDMSNRPSRAGSLDLRDGSRDPLTRTLATLRIYEKHTFYLCDSSLTGVDASVQVPDGGDLDFKALTTKTELDALVAGGYDLVLDFGRLKRGLGNGAMAFLIFVERELASMGWAATTRESKEAFRVYPYNVDLDDKACIVGEWTNPKYRDSGLCVYIGQKRRQLLKEKGFTFERSLVEENAFEYLVSTTRQRQSGVAYKRRTYAKVALPGILGGEVWKETPLDETDTKPTQKFTLLMLAVSSPPVSNPFVPAR